MNRLIEALKKWFQQVPTGIADLREEVIGPGVVTIKFVPLNPKSSGIELQFTPEKVDIYCARHSSFEDAPIDANVVLDVCDAVRRGHLTIEITHLYKGLSFQERATLELSSDVWYDRYSGIRLPFKQYPVPQTIRYEPWDISDNTQLP